MHQRRQQHHCISPLLGRDITSELAVLCQVSYEMNPINGDAKLHYVHADSLPLGQILVSCCDRSFSWCSFWQALDTSVGFVWSEVSFTTRRPHFDKILIANRYVLIPWVMKCVSRWKAQRWNCMPRYPHSKEAGYQDCCCIQWCWHWFLTCPNGEFHVHIHTIKLLTWRWIGRWGILYWSRTICWELRESNGLVSYGRLYHNLNAQLRIDKIIEVCHRSGAQVDMIFPPLIKNAI